jgi:hypothetical protein
MEMASSFQVGRMNREEPHELFQPLGHAAVERRELLKCSNLGPLLVGLREQAQPETT